MRPAQQLVRAAQRAQRGEEQERAAAARPSTGSAASITASVNAGVVRIGRQALAAGRAAPGAAKSNGLAQRRVSASAAPSSRVKWPKSSPTASVAEVKIQARGWSAICRRNSSADESGVTCRRAAWLNTSTQRTPVAGLAPRACRARSASALAARRAHDAEPLGALGLRGERLVERRASAVCELLEAVGKARQRAAPGSTPRRAAGFAEREAQVARRLLQRGWRARRAPARRRPRRAARARASRASSTSCALETVSPKNRRAVSGSWCASSKITRVARRQQLGDAFVAQHHVGEEQMVVDHHHVGGERVAARAHHEAVARSRGSSWPRQLSRVEVACAQTGASSGTSARSARSPVVLSCGEALDARELRRLLARLEARLLRARAPQAVEADVVGAALEQRRARARGERLAHRRQVAVEQLVLQRLGAGRDDDLAAGEQRRHQVGEGLAGAGAGLGDQHAVALDRLVDRLRHLELLRAQLEARHRAASGPSAANARSSAGLQFAAAPRPSPRRGATRSPMACRKNRCRARRAPHAGRGAADLEPLAQAPAHAGGDALALHVPPGPSASRCGAMSRCTVPPTSRGETSKPVAAPARHGLLRYHAGRRADHLPLRQRRDCR